MIKTKLCGGTSEHITGANKKNLDFIVLNSLKEKGAGFGHDTNKITIIDKHMKVSPFRLKSKQAVAIDIANMIIELIPIQN